MDKLVKPKKKMLNRYHVIFLVQNTMVGIAMFSVPNTLSPVEYNQWIIPLFYGVIGMLILFFMVKLGKRYPNETLFEINDKLLGKFFGKLINLGIFLYATIQVSSVSSGYLRLVQSITLPNYTINITGIALFVVMLLIVNGGIKSVARFCIISFFSTLWMTFFLQWAFYNATWIHLIPRFEHTINDWAIAIHKGTASIVGLSLILFYFPYIQDQQKAYKHSVIGLWISITFYFLISIASVVYFSKWQLKNVLYPVLNLYQAVQLSFVERIENLGVTLWIFLILSTTAAFLWVGKKALDALLSNHKNKTRHLYYITIVCLLYIIGPVPDRLQRTIFNDWIMYGDYFLYIYPLLLLMIDTMKSKNNKSTAVEG